MPKMKTNRGAAKRFKVRGSGSIKKRAAFRNHINTKMSQKRIRQLRHDTAICEADRESVERQLCLK